MKTMLSDSKKTMLFLSSILIIVAAALSYLTYPTSISHAASECNHYEKDGLAVTVFDLQEYPLNWIQQTTSDYVLCHHPQEESVEQVQNILSRAISAMKQMPYQFKDVRPVIYIFPELRADLGVAPWISTNYYVSKQNNTWMVYLSLSHKEWETWPGGVLRLPIQAYHTRVISNEYFEMLHDFDSPSPSWFRQGFSWYVGLNYFLGWNEHAPRLARTVQSDPDHEVFMTVHKGDTKSFGTNSVYVGGGVITSYLEGRFDGILNELISHQNSSFNRALQSEVLRRGSTVEDEFRGLLAWVDGCARGDCHITPFRKGPMPTATPTPMPTATPTPMPTPAPSLEETQREYFYSLFTPPLPGPLSYQDWIAYRDPSGIFPR